MTNHRDQWQTATILTPDDVPVGTPIEEVANRWMDLSLRMEVLPDPSVGGVATDALGVLALGENIRRFAVEGRAIDIQRALLRGATWRQVAAALDTTVTLARATLRDWTLGQRRLYQQTEAAGGRRYGHSEQRHAAVLALLEVPEDESAVLSDAERQAHSTPRPKEEQ